MTEQVSLNLDFDYQNLKYKIGAKYPGDTIPAIESTQKIVDSDGLISLSEISSLVGGLPSSVLPTQNVIPFSIMDSNGILMKEGIITGGNSFASRVYGATGIRFGINNQGNYGYDRSGNNSKLYSSNPFANYPISYSYDINSAGVGVSGYLVTYLETTDTPLSKLSNSYIGTPIQVTDGGGCLHASVSAISNNRITWQNNSLVGNVSSCNFNDAVVTSISGSLSGNSYRVLSYDNTNKYLWLDKSGSLTNNIIKVQPRTVVTGYSCPENNYSYIPTFNISPSIVEEIGYKTGSIITCDDYDLDIGGGVVVTCSQITASNDQYLRDPSIGDILFFTNSLGNPASGLVIDWSKDTTSTTMTYYPASTSHPSQTFYTLKRSTRFNLEYYPKFGDSYTTVSVGDSTYPFFGESISTAPGATIEVTAGDYDSAFGTVTDTSHFHMGPVTLTNGVVLTGNNVFISGRLFNNNPTSTTSLKNWSRWTSSDANIASTHTGIYSKFGALVGTYSQAFTTPDMLTLEVTASIGDASVKRIVNLPVAPPV